MTRLEAEPCASGCEVFITADLLTVIFQGTCLRAEILGLHNVGPEMEGCHNVSP